jgi:hypothetical protein
MLVFVILIYFSQGLAVGWNLCPDHFCSWQVLRLKKVGCTISVALNASAGVRAEANGNLTAWTDLDGTIITLALIVI